MPISALSQSCSLAALSSRAVEQRLGVPNRVTGPASVRPPRAPGATGPVRALALPQVPIDPQAITQGVAGVSLTVATSLAAANIFRHGPTLRLRNLDTAAGMAAILGTLLATHHAFVAQGVPGWLLPAAAMGTCSVILAQEGDDLGGLASWTTLGAWLLVACFEGLLNQGMPMAAALPLVLAWPVHVLAEPIAEDLARRREEERGQ